MLFLFLKRYPIKKVDKGAMSQETMTGNNPINWKVLNLVDDEDFIEGTQEF